MDLPSQPGAHGPAAAAACSCPNAQAPPALLWVWQSLLFGAQPWVLGPRGPGARVISLLQEHSGSPRVEGPDQGSFSEPGQRASR